jgi:hypothetical protein
MLIVLGAVENLFFIAPNVLRLVDERDLEAQFFKLALLPIRTKNDECSTSALFATNRCYLLGG